MSVNKWTRFVIRQLGSQTVATLPQRQKQRKLQRVVLFEILEENCKHIAIVKIKNFWSHFVRKTFYETLFLWRFVLCSVIRSKIGFEICATDPEDEG